MLLVQATSGQAPLVWAKGIRWLSVMECLPSTICCCSHPPVNTATLQLPLPNTGWHPDTWSLSLPKTLQLGAAGAAPPVWAKWNRVLLVVCKQQEQTAAVIPDSRGGCGMLLLEVSEQKSLAAPFT